ncbi:MAG: transposase [Ruminococcaceae bacterium]|nr:transposase [Oscillospiraceae bacterium]
MLCENNTLNLLELEGAEIKNVWNEAGMKHISVEIPKKLHCCPKCGEMTDAVHDYRHQKVRDISIYGKLTIIHLRKRRYRCNSCGKRFAETNTFVPRYHQVTSRLVAHLISDFGKVRSASDIAKDHGVSISTTLRYFDLVNYSLKSLPEVLSIDEFKGNAGGEKFQCIITDAKHKKVLDILPNRKSADLIRYFRDFSTRSSVKVVVMI